MVATTNDAIARLTAALAERDARIAELAVAVAEFDRDGYTAERASELRGIIRAALSATPPAEGE